MSIYITISSLAYLYKRSVVLAKNVYVCWNQQIQTSLCTKIHIHTYIYNTRYQSVFEPTKWNLSVSLIFYHSKKVPLLQQVFCWIYMHMHVCKFNQCLMLTSVILPTFALKCLITLFICVLHYLKSWLKQIGTYLQKFWLSLMQLPNSDTHLQHIYLPTWIFLYLIS